MKNLIIIGAGGLGREVQELYCSDENIPSNLKFKGFLDDRPNPPLVEMEVIGKPDSYIPEPDDVFICAVGDPQQRRRLVEKLGKKGGAFISLIHPSAIISASAKIGEGCIIKPFSVISCHTEIGNHTVIQPHCTVEHDVKVGPYCLIGSGSVLQGGAFVPEGQTLAPLSKLAHTIFFSIS